MKYQTTTRSDGSANMVIFGGLSPFVLKVSLVSYKPEREESFDIDEYGNVSYMSPQDEELCLQGDF